MAEAQPGKTRETGRGLGTYAAIGIAMKAFEGRQMIALPSANPA
jgi:hypothetical protein